MIPEYYWAVDLGVALGSASAKVYFRAVIDMIASQVGRRSSVAETHKAEPDPTQTYFCLDSHYDNSR